METLIANAFGRYVDVQRGEADQITEAARDFFHVSEGVAALSPETVLVSVCKL